MGNEISSASRRFCVNSSKAKRPLVSIVVVTVDTPKLTQGCLESVLRNTTVPYELIVVNNSRASKIRRCLKGFKSIRIIQNSRNLGYAKAANQGAYVSGGKYLCFLNSDTLVPPQWLERLLKAFRMPCVGAVGPVTKSYGGYRYGYPYDWPPQGLPENEATSLFTDSALQRWFGHRLERVSWLSGFCLLIPKRVMQRIGLFDERFFFGFEDFDYSFRLRLFGYRLVRAKSLFVYHKKSGSIRSSRSRRLYLPSGLRFLAKWQPFLGTTFAEYLQYPLQKKFLKINWQAFLQVLDRNFKKLHAHRHLLLS